MRPPVERRSIAMSIAPGRISTSELTAMRSAWNTLLAGWPRRRTAAGTAEATTSANCPVLSRGRAATMAAAMRRPKRVSPFSMKRRASSCSVLSFTSLAAVRS